MSAITSSRAVARGNLYRELRRLLDELESLKPYFDSLPKEDRLLAELVLLKKSVILEEAKRLDMGVR